MSVVLCLYRMFAFFLCLSGADKADKQARQEKREKEDMERLVGGAVTPVTRKIT